MDNETDPEGSPLLRAMKLEEKLNISKIYLKLEMHNPTRTHKDRIAKAHVKQAKDLGFSGITVGTCGNYGVAIAYFAKKEGIKAVIFVPRQYRNSRVEEMKEYGADVIFVDGAYEEAVLMSKIFAKTMNYYDANPGTQPAVDYEAYSLISKEILEEIEPYAVFVPVGNGSTLAGIYYGFKKYGVMPRIIGVTTSYGNQVLNAFYTGRVEEVKDFVETDFNEPLVSSISFDLQNALEAIKDSNGYIFGFGDDTALKYAKILEMSEGIKALPASTLTLVGLVKFVRKFGVNNENFVLLLTGGI
ncbi:PLP-dependent lyase/thiolase [Pyrococcus furiosus DSM 3638]|nr:MULTISPECIES: pyridoxal-phosphate dependent enzyme [Pyrococcus]AFN04543.1 threonine synthase [Pyrococcus furiosus COM1]MDK2869172.1 threonine synthase [Pyrococcus sp.]QEK77766.1 PLP-dependent lyase/thiolase [Pyrococcus furiosus DSM 3638]